MERGLVEVSLVEASLPVAGERAEEEVAELVISASMAE